MDQQEEQPGDSHSPHSLIRAEQTGERRPAGRFYLAASALVVGVLAAFLWLTQSYLAEIDRPPEYANGSVATLKWSRPEYVERLKGMMGSEVDYARRPAEDFARALLTLEDRDGTELIVEATTTWAYVGPGLRIQLELLGPEYAMEFSSLNTGLKIFMSRQVSGQEGEDLVEKQNAEQGLMPVLEDEPGIYGYVNENRHMVECFRKGETPLETFHDGVAVMEILMALYRSAELGETVKLPCPELEDYVPPVARTEG